jgi:hypothetical protein
MISLVMYERLIEGFPVTKRAFPPDGKTRVGCHFRRLYREKEDWVGIPELVDFGLQY